MRLLIIILLSFSTQAQAEEQVIIKYKQHESIDLGNLEIKGNIIAPGDLSAKQADRIVFSENLYQRVTFRKEMKQDVKNLR